MPYLDTDIEPGFDPMHDLVRDDFSDAALPRATRRFTDDFYGGDAL